MLILRELKSAPASEFMKMTFPSYRGLLGEGIHGLTIAFFYPSNFRHFCFPTSFGIFFSEFQSIINFF
jgi:hypothetical protein